MDVHHNISRLTDEQLLQLLLQFKQEENKTLVLQSASDARIKRIKEYIQNHQVLYPIHLHNQTNTPVQRELDELILDVRWKFYQQEQVEVHMPSAAKKIKRTRPRSMQRSHQLDIDVEQQAEQEVVQEVAQEVMQEQENNAKYVDSIDFSRFKELYRQHIPFASSEEEAFQLWHRVLATAVIHKKAKADISEIDALEYVKIKESDLLYEIKPGREDFSGGFHFSSFRPKRQPSPIKKAPHSKINGLTEKAAKKIIQHARQFAYGVDWKHLPAGFQWVVNPDNPDVYTLDYDHVVEYSRDPLLIKLIKIHVLLRIIPGLKLNLHSGNNIHSAQNY